jgi:hypothetical protein
VVAIIAVPSTPHLTGCVARAMSTSGIVTS